MTVELTEFLLARIAEDQEIAQEATNDGHRWLVEEETISLWPDDLEPCTGNIHFPRKAHAYHAATWEPARILAECEAKRRIVEHRTYETSELRPTTTPGRFERVRVLVPYAADDEDLLRLLAMPYADHADYRQEWRP